MSMPFSEDFNHKQLYLLEILLKTVEITDESITNQEKPLLVKLKFLDFPSLEITRKDFLKRREKEASIEQVDVEENIDTEENIDKEENIDTDQADNDQRRERGSKDAEDGVRESDEIDDTLPGDPSTFNIGKSCMFPMLPLELIKQIQRYPLVIQIYRKNQDSQYNLVGGARVRLGPDFEDVILEAGEEYTQLPISNILDKEIPVKDIFGVPIGKMDLFLRLSCYGVTIVNQFQLVGENGEYMFRNDKRDNTLKAQEERGFMFSLPNEFGKLDYPSDLNGLKPIIATEDNTLPIKGAELDSPASSQFSPNDRFKFVTRAGELAPKQFIPQHWPMENLFPDQVPWPLPFPQGQPEGVDMYAADTDPRKLALLQEALLEFQKLDPANKPRGQRTCCDSCCDAKIHGCSNPKNETGRIEPLFFGSFKKHDPERREGFPDQVSWPFPSPENKLGQPKQYLGGIEFLSDQVPMPTTFSYTDNKPKMSEKLLSAPINAAAWLWSKIQSATQLDLIDPETLAWSLAVQIFKDVLPGGQSHENNRTIYPYRDQDRVVKQPPSLPTKSDSVDVGKFSYDLYNPVDKIKGKGNKPCFFENLHGARKSYPKISKFSSSPCHNDTTNTKITSGKYIDASNVEEKLECNGGEVCKIDSKEDKPVLESQPEKTFEPKLEVITKLNQSVISTPEERLIGDTPDINHPVTKSHQAKSESTLSKSRKVRRKDSAEIFMEYKGKLVKKNASNPERNLDTPSRRMRRKYMSIYKYTDGMYPGMNVGHRHCIHLSRNVPKSMGWLWNTADSGDGLKKRRGWKPGAINKTIANMIKMTKVAAGIEVAVEEERPKGPKVVRKVRRPISAGSGAASTVDTRGDDDSYYDASPLPPTLHVHKKDGVYFISMNPLRLEEDDDEQVPLMFKIDADESAASESASDSSLEIECTAPGALRRRMVKPPPVCQDKQTATEDV